MYQQIYTDPTAIQEILDNLNNINDLPPIHALVDGRGLACPMPLLKTKLALKALTDGTVYTLATDQNSAQDLSQFCTKNNHSLAHWQSDDTNITTFHFLITKIAENC